MKNITASDRSALIKLASSLPAGSPERKAILAGLSKSADDSGDSRRALAYNKIEEVQDIFKKKVIPAFEAILDVASEQENDSDAKKFFAYMKKENKKMIDKLTSFQKSFS